MCARITNRGRSNLPTFNRLGGSDASLSKKQSAEKQALPEKTLSGSKEVLDAGNCTLPSNDASAIAEFANSRLTAESGITLQARVVKKVSAVYCLLSV
jgi:hypothetical protein